MSTATRTAREKGKLTGLLMKFLTPKSALGLFGKCVLLLVIPYAYLMLCGLVFDYWLKWYFMTGFIFYSLIALFIGAVCLDIFMVIRFMKKRKGE